MDVIDLLIAFVRLFDICTISAALHWFFGIDIGSISSTLPFNEFVQLSCLVQEGQVATSML